MSSSATVQHLDISYDPIRDRLLLVVRTQTERRPYWLTRRMLRALLDGLVTLLMRSSDVVSQAAANVRSDVLLFEHMGAMARRLEPEPSTRAPEDGRILDGVPEGLLLRQVDMAVEQGRVAVTLTAETHGSHRITLSRDNAHQLISSLYERSVKANWDLMELAWLGRRSHFVVPDDVRPS